MKWFRTISGEIISIDFIYAIIPKTYNDKINIILITKDGRQTVHDTYYKDKKYVEYGLYGENIIDYESAAKSQMDILTDRISSENWEGIIWYHENLRDEDNDNSWKEDWI